MRHTMLLVVERRPVLMRDVARVEVIQLDPRAALSKFDETALRRAAVLLLVEDVLAVSVRDELLILQIDRELQDVDLTVAFDA